MTADQATAAHAHPAAHAARHAPDRLVPGTGEAQRHILVVLVHGPARRAQPRRAA